MVAVAVATICFLATIGFSDARAAQGKVTVSTEIAQILFPSDQLALVSTSGGKDWSADVINNSSDLSKFAKDHPGFRDVFRPKFERIMADALKKEAPGFYDEVSRVIDANYTAGDAEVALSFLRSSAGEKVVRTMHAAVSRGPRRQPTDNVDITKLLTVPEQHTVEKFSRSAASKIMDVGQYQPATQNLIDRAFKTSLPEIQNAVNDAVAAERKTK